jgi:hypothetical protein
VPVLKLELGAVAVPVDQHHRVIIVVLDQQDTGIARMPSADPNEGLGRQHAHRIVQAAPLPRLNYTSANYASAS